MLCVTGQGFFSCLMEGGKGKSFIIEFLLNGSWCLFDCLVNVYGET